TSLAITLPGLLGDADRESGLCRCTDALVVGSACGLGVAGGALSRGCTSTSRAGALSTEPPLDAGAGGGVRPALAARPSSASGPTGVSRAVFSEGSWPDGAAVAGAGARTGARAAMSDVGILDAGGCRLGPGSKIGGGTGAAAIAGLGADGLGVATVAVSCAAETGGTFVGEAGVSLVGSELRARVSAGGVGVGGVGVGSGARVTGSDGGICDCWEGATGVAGSGTVACSCGEAVAPGGLTLAS